MQRAGDQPIASDGSAQQASRRHAVFRPDPVSDRLAHRGPCTRAWSVRSRLACGPASLSGRASAPDSATIQSARHNSHRSDASCGLGAEFDQIQPIEPCGGSSARIRLVAPRRPFRERAHRAGRLLGDPRRGAPDAGLGTCSTARDDRWVSVNVSPRQFDDPATLLTTSTRSTRAASRSSAQDGAYRIGVHAQPEVARGVIGELRISGFASRSMISERVFGARGMRQ